MKILRLLTLTLAAIAIAAPGAEARKQAQPRNVSIDLPTAPEYASQRYGNLDYGIRLQVRSDVSDSRIVNLTELPSKDAANFPSVEIENPLVQSFEQYLDSYASALGLKVGSSPSSDLILRVTVKDFRLRVKDFNVKKKIFSSSAAMVIQWELLDSDNRTVISPMTSTGRSSSRSREEITQPLNTAFEQALSGIDWDRIASQLKIASTARQEKNKQVTGAGNSALEHTVIRWFITSSPQGADVSWRVISSTPDVANTNANFVGNTPYESTESFDIKGLTYNNSGNVQIEVTCERPGYLPQRKRFNLRQAIDQKEISAKFNLVKEELPEN